MTRYILCILLIIGLLGSISAAQADNRYETVTARYAQAAGRCIEKSINGKRFEGRRNYALMAANYLKVVELLSSGAVPNAVKEALINNTPTE